MGAYLRLVGSLAQNLARRVGEDLADCAAVCKRGLVYKLRSIRLRYDDVGPAGSQDWQILPEQLAKLVESIENKPWYCEMDRRTAQDLVRDGGVGCFVIRPSASTKSLTLTLWYQNRPYNILIRQRDDGLLALGSKKNQEMTFQSVDEMVRYYEREPLILYSGGELTGRTRLKAPPPGLVRSKRSSATSNSQVMDSRRNSSLNGARRTSEGEDFRSSTDLRGPPTACSRTLSSGHVEIPFSSSITRRLANSAPDIEFANMLSSSPRKVSAECLTPHPPALPPRPAHLTSTEEYRRGSVPSSSKEIASRTEKIRNASVHNRPLPSIPGEHEKELSSNNSIPNSPISESTSL
ncbi:uncharacterized protein LOC124364179 [Homalodisca vitripennis]|nr:uncharacterized protein LOC124364179 [Homalodisca vitripennis]